VNGKGENSSGGFNNGNDVRNAGGEPQNASSSSSARGKLVFSAKPLVRALGCVWRDDSVFFVSDAETALYRELWHACAGPLVTVPREGERVFYFPQGHIEQVSVLPPVR